MTKYFRANCVQYQTQIILSQKGNILVSIRQGYIAHQFAERSFAVKKTLCVIATIISDNLCIYRVLLKDAPVLIAYNYLTT
jgi:hypothetical protein